MPPRNILDLPRLFCRACWSAKYCPTLPPLGEEKSMCLHIIIWVPYSVSVHRWKYSRIPVIELIRTRKWKCYIWSTINKFALIWPHMETMFVSYLRVRLALHRVKAIGVLPMLLMWKVWVRKSSRNRCESKGWIGWYSGSWLLGRSHRVRRRSIDPPRGVVREDRCVKGQFSLLISSGTLQCRWVHLISNKQ